MADPHDDPIASKPGDWLLPSSIGIPNPDPDELAALPILETLWFSVGLALYVPGESDTDAGVIRRENRAHASWPINAFHALIQHQYQGRSILLFRIMVRELCEEIADAMCVGELLDEDDSPFGTQYIGDLTFRYDGRWWMAPEGFDPKANYHPSNAQQIHSVAAVQFTGKVFAWS